MVQQLRTLATLVEQQSSVPNIHMRQLSTNDANSRGYDTLLEIHKCVHTHTQHMHVCTYIHRHTTQTRTCVHATHAHTNVYMHTQTHAHIHTYMYIHKHTHTHYSTHKINLKRKPNFMHPAYYRVLPHRLRRVSFYSTRSCEGPGFSTLLLNLRLADQICHV